MKTTTRPRRAGVRALVPLLAFVLAVPAAARPSQEAPVETADWTVMFYMDSDNDLESAQMEDLREMLAVGSTERVNLVALVDRAAASNEDDGYTSQPVANLRNWTTAKLLVIDKGKLDELADWGEVNMGDPETLEHFVTETVAAFPARRYGLVFGDHGSAWPGACADESAQDDLLTIVEIGAALARTTKTSGRLELVGFDACLMANFEVAHTLAPSSRFMIASEELEPGSGWNYTPLLTALVSSPATGGAEFGRVAADTFHAFYNDPDEAGEEGLGITLAVIALDRIAALESAINALGDQCDRSLRSSGRGAWLKLADAHSEAEEYGASRRGEPGASVYDLQDLAELIREQAPNAETAAAADRVIRAVTDAVVYRVHGDARPHANGLSIFCPPDAETLERADPIPYSATSFGRGSAWAKFLATYTGVEAADTTAPDLGDVASDDTDLVDSPDTGEDTVSITSSVKADDLESADFVLAMADGDEQLVLGQVPASVDEKGRLHEEWDGGWFTIGDGKTELVCPITDFDVVGDADETYFVQVPAQVRPKGAADWDDVTLFFYLDFAEDGSVTGEFVYAFEESDDFQREYELDAGDSVRPVYLHYDAHGEESLVASDDPADILKVGSSEDLSVAYAEVDDGDYLIGFVVEDFAGNIAEDYVAVQVGSGGEDEPGPDGAGVAAGGLRSGRRIGHGVRPVSGGRESTLRSGREWTGAAHGEIGRYPDPVSAFE